MLHTLATLDSSFWITAISVGVWGLGLYLRFRAGRLWFTDVAIDFPVIQVAVGIVWALATTLSWMWSPGADLRMQLSGGGLFLAVAEDLPGYWFAGLGLAGALSAYLVQQWTGRDFRADLRRSMRRKRNSRSGQRRARRRIDSFATKTKQKK